MKPTDAGRRLRGERWVGTHPTARWLIFYRVAADHVLIVRIIHAKRDLPALFGE